MGGDQSHDAIESGQHHARLSQNIVLRTAQIREVLYPGILLQHPLPVGVDGADHKPDAGGTCTGWASGVGDASQVADAVELHNCVGDEGREAQASAPPADQLDNVDVRGRQGRRAALGQLHILDQLEGCPHVLLRRLGEAADLGEGARGGVGLAADLHDQGTEDDEAAALRLANRAVLEHLVRLFEGVLPDILGQRKASPQDGGAVRLQRQLVGKPVVSILLDQSRSLLGQGFGGPFPLGLPCFLREVGGPWRGLLGALLGGLGDRLAGSVLKG